MNNTTKKKLRVLILCTGNSARSQMAEGLLRHLGGEEFEAFSAGTQPSFVRSEAIQVMQEMGIDITAQRSKSVEELLEQEFDFVITVCDNAKESCPIFPGKAQHLHQSFADPPPPNLGTDEYRLNIFRQVRDDLQEWLKGFINNRE